MKPKTVMFACPAYGGMMHTTTVLSLFQAIPELTQANIHLALKITNGDSHVDRARNTVAMSFLNSGLDYLLFVDSDIGFQAKSIIRLVNSGYDVCGVAYPKKEIDWEKIKRIAPDCKDAAELEMRAMNYVINFPDPSKITITPDKFAEVQDLGTGFMLIHRSVFLKMIEAYPAMKHMAPVASDGKPIDDKPHYAFFDAQVDPESQQFLTEDWQFCRQWQRIGGKVWLDLTGVLSHTGSMHFTGAAIASIQKV